MFLTFSFIPDLIPSVLKMALSVPAMSRSLAAILILISPKNSVQAGHSNRSDTQEFKYSRQGSKKTPFRNRADRRPGLGI